MNIRQARLAPAGMKMSIFSIACGPYGTSRWQRTRLRVSSERAAQRSKYCWKSATAARLLYCDSQ